MRPAIAIALSLVLASVAFAGTLTGKVVKIVDGDMIDVLDGSNAVHRVRLHGVDALETGQPFAKRAREATGDLVHERQVVVTTNEEPDRYGRLVGRVTLGGRDVGLALLEAGWVWQFTRYDTSVLYRDAEQAARRARRGLWADPKPAPPWEWRKMPKGEREKRRETVPL
ncbi:MAG: hypothetical protein FJ275_01890 [Planctomycetes bacterium]|nr:hypothetical protein [Planctomycetota bacterium]